MPIIDAILAWIAEKLLGGLFKPKPPVTIAQEQAKNEAKPDTEWHKTVDRL